SQGDDGEVAALRTLAAHRIDGLLLSTVGIEGDRFDALVTRRGIPCVFFDSSLNGEGDGSVLLDNALGIDRLVEHLADHGHRRIGLLVGSVRETSGWERRDAFVRAMRRLGLSASPALIAGDRWTLEAGHAATLVILPADPRPTALVASSVELALGAVLACRELDLAIPEDVALATFDDAYFAELLDPPLTAVAYDPSEVGRRAAELLVAAIGNGEGPRRDVTVPVELVVRRSCGC